MSGINYLLRIGGGVKKTISRKRRESRKIGLALKMSEQKPKSYGTHLPCHGFSSGEYFEPQNEQQCLLHAINMAVGYCLFTAAELCEMAKIFDANKSAKGIKHHPSATSSKGWFTIDLLAHCLGKKQLSLYKVKILFNCAFKTCFKNKLNFKGWFCRTRLF